MRWRYFSQRVTELDIPALMRSAILQRKLTDEEAAAYGAPFPDRTFQAGALVFPRLVPIQPDSPGAYDNRVALEKLKTLELPMLLPWADQAGSDNRSQGALPTEDLPNRSSTSSHPGCRSFPPGRCR